MRVLLNDRRFVLVLVVFSVLCFAPGNRIEAQQPSPWWPQWRGPNRDGAVMDFVAPKTWPETLKQVWRVEVGEGHASPLVAGDKIYLHSRLDDKETATCFRLDTGDVVWRESYPAPYTMNRAASRHGKGPKSTPVLHAGKLYTLGITGILSCFDAETGTRKWQKDFSGQFSLTTPEFGTAMSPIVADGLLIVHIGGLDKGALIAFDAATGEEKWQWAEDGPGYASPVVAMLGGVKQLVTQSENHCIGIALDSGKLLWQMPFTTPYDQNIITSVVAGETVILSGLQQGTTAVRPVRHGDEWEAEQVWHNADVSMYMSSPVLHGGLLFGFSHQQKGRFFCLDASTGTTRWTGEGREGENAAILRSEDYLFFLMDDGRLIVAAPDAESHKPIAAYKVADSPTWAHPAIFNRHILVKDVSTLTLWRVD